MAEQEPSQTIPETSETSGFNASEDSQQAKDMLEILNNYLQSNPGDAESLIINEDGQENEELVTKIEQSIPSDEQSEKTPLIASFIDYLKKPISFEIFYQFMKISPEIEETLKAKKINILKAIEIIKVIINPTSAMDGIFDSNFLELITNAVQKLYYIFSEEEPIGVALKYEFMTDFLRALLVLMLDELSENDIVEMNAQLEILEGISITWRKYGNSPEYLGESESHIFGDFTLREIPGYLDFITSFAIETYNSNDDEEPQTETPTGEGLPTDSSEQQEVKRTDDVPVAVAVPVVKAPKSWAQSWDELHKNFGDIVAPQTPKKSPILRVGGNKYRKSKKRNQKKPNKRSKKQTGGAGQPVRGIKNFAAESPLGSKTLLVWATKFGFTGVARYGAHIESPLAFKQIQEADLPQSADLFGTKIINSLSAFNDAIIHDKTIGEANKAKWKTFIDVYVKNANLQGLEAKATSMINLELSGHMAAEAAALRNKLNKLELEEEEQAGDENSPDYWKNIMKNIEKRKTILKTLETQTVDDDGDFEKPISLIEHNITEDDITDDNGATIIPGGEYTKVYRNKKDFRAQRKEYLKWLWLESTSAQVVDAIINRFTKGSGGEGAITYYDEEFKKQTESFLDSKGYKTHMEHYQQLGFNNSKIAIEIAANPQAFGIMGNFIVELSRTKDETNDALSTFVAQPLAQKLAEFDAEQLLGSGHVTDVLNSPISAATSLYVAYKLSNLAKEGTEKILGPNGKKSFLPMAAQATVGAATAVGMFKGVMPNVAPVAGYFLRPIADKIGQDIVDLPLTDATILAGGVFGYYLGKWQGERIGRYFDKPGEQSSANIWAKNLGRVGAGVGSLGGGFFLRALLTESAGKAIINGNAYLLKALKMLPYSEFIGNYIGIANEMYFFYFFARIVPQMINKYFFGIKGNVKLKTPTFSGILPSIEIPISKELVFEIVGMVILYASLWIITGGLGPLGVIVTSGSHIMSQLRLWGIIASLFGYSFNYAMIKYKSSGWIAYVSSTEYSWPAFAPFTKIMEKYNKRMDEAYQFMTHGVNYGKGTDIDWNTAQGTKGAKFDLKPPTFATCANGTTRLNPDAQGNFDISQCGTAVPDESYSAMMAYRAIFTSAVAGFEVFNAYYKISTDNLKSSGEIRQEVEKTLGELRKNEEQYTFTVDKLKVAFNAISGFDGSDDPPYIRKFKNMTKDFQESQAKLLDAQEKIARFFENAKRNLGADVDRAQREKLQQQSMEQARTLQQEELKLKKDLAIRQEELQRELADSQKEHEKQLAAQQEKVQRELAKQAEQSRLSAAAIAAAGIPQTQAASSSPSSSSSSSSSSPSSSSSSPPSVAFPLYTDLMRDIKERNSVGIATALLDNGINISSIKTELEKKGIFKAVLAQYNEQLAVRDQRPSSGHSSGIQLAETIAQQRKQARLGGKTKRSKKQKKGKRTRRNK